MAKRPKYEQKPLYDSKGFYGTEASQTVCKAMAEASTGQVIHCFSRGKDSLAAWLYLQNWFDDIIPITFVTVPGLSFVERSLKYYERYFGVKIHRAISHTWAKDLVNGSYQTLADYREIMRDEPWQFEEVDQAHLLKHHLRLPEETQISLGISMYDNVNRLTWVRNTGGVHTKRGVFYPCFDWKPKQISAYIQRMGVSLPEDYLIGGQTLEGTPLLKFLKPMKELFPQDYEKLKLWFPLLESRIARNEFRKRKAEKV